MRLVVESKNAYRINRIFEFILYVFGYTVAFLLTEKLFETFVIDDEHKILYSVVAVLVIYVLNQVVKPLLITLTMPITGITFGLFYFVINTVILKLTDWIMGPRLDFTDIWILFFIAILLSFIHFIIEEVVIKPIVKRAKIK